MRILWVKAGGLVPVDTGGKIRSYNILRQLANQHQVAFFSFYAAHPNDQHPELKSVFEQVICVPLQLPEPKSAAEMWNYATNLSSLEPYGVRKYCRAEPRTKLRELLQRETFDVIVCDFVQAAGVIPWELPTPKVLFTHNVEATIWRRHFEVAKNPLWRAVSWWEWRKMEAAERRYLRLADLVLTVSETDRDAFAPFLEKAPLVISTGVDIDYFYASSAEESPDSLVFTGSMDWLPNEDSIFYFVEAILPLIKQRRPGVRLDVVGRSPSPRLQALAAKEPAINLTGWVEDVRPYLERSAVCIVPLRIGGGTRLKIFEAMSMDKAVVSTTIGAEGLPVHSGENILLADSPQEFADAVVTLLQDREHRRRLGRAARALVEENYSWPKIANIFAAALRETLVTGHRK